MKHHVPFSVSPFHQTNWDWRAAGNFIGGGSGTGLLLFAAVQGGEWYWLYALAALGSIGAGLTCVWLEIGKPWRAINVFLHPGTSWMTREAIVAPAVFLAGLAAVWMNGGVAAWVAAAFGMLFLFCQARILFASKGIPAWRETRLQALVMATGLTEGCGWLLVLNSLTGIAPGDESVLALVALSLARLAVWRSYVNRLATVGAPRKAIEVLRRANAPFAWGGSALPVGLAVVGWLAGSAPIASLAGLIAALAGMWIKYVIVARAAFNQGFALPALPTRGVGVPGPAVRPGWSAPAAGAPREGRPGQAERSEWLGSNGASPARRRA
jgi:phenylacetyl-CoA:acceptor oxidoreductase subunit 2